MSLEGKKAEKDILKFWTVEQRRQARPVPIGAKRAGVRQAEETQGEHILAQGVSQAVEVTDTELTQSPYCSIGALYFKSRGDNYRGTACVIGQNLILTAGHNLRFQGEMSTMLMFLPVASNGTSDYGVWIGEEIYAPPLWVMREDRGYDVGIVKLKSGGKAKKPIGEVTGILSCLYEQNVDNTSSWLAVGYPDNYGGGKCMYQQQGTYTKTHPENVIFMTGNMGEGTSGGPWLSRDPKGAYVINGIHAAAPMGGDEEVASPLFTQWIRKFIEVPRES